MSIPNRQIGWSNEANLLWQISKQLDRVIQIAGAKPPTPPPPGLKLTFASTFPVVDATDVALWNTLFGSSFTEVIVDGLNVNLVGSPGFYLPPYCLTETGLVSIVDEINCVLGGLTFCLGYNYSLKTVSLPEAASFAGNQNFASSGTDSTDPITFYLPSCTQLGATVGNNGLFYLMLSKNVTLTIAASLMTCNSGLPDGDIQYLQANNTVTVITV